jgi:site-specific recombinase XerD
MDIKILSRLLGHADVNITYNIYVHLYGDGFDEMYEALVGNRMPTPKNLPLIEESNV